jgi:hypothetical protein
MCAYSRFKNCLPVAFAILFAGVGLAQQPASQKKADAEFYRGYYLQHETGDFADAVKAYKQSVKLGPSSKIQTAIDAEMAELQEELATADFAQVMPSKAIAYLEISNPADHLEKIATIMGLTGKQFSAGDDKVTLRIEDEFAIPSDFQLSPALLREFKKIRGAAIAITDVRDQVPPFEGIAAIHAGQSDLIGGILETGIQLVPATENIGGFPTFSIAGHIWIVKTNRLLIVASSKDKIENCLRRITNQNADSLANVESYKTARAGNQDAALFAYVNPAMAIKKFDDIFEGELAIARMALDLDHMEHVTAALTATDSGVRGRLSVKYAEDHNSFGYGLIRTVPLSNKALKHIPSGSAAVVGMGLNPQMLLAAQAAGSRQLSALDIGREFFANIEEVGLFVLPSMTQQNDEIPNVGLVIASSDIEKSTNLWNQMLTLPSMMNIEDGPTAKSISIAGVEARQYTFADDDAPQLVIAKLGDEALVAGTPDAVKAVIEAGKSGTTLANDARAKAFWESKSEHTSKAAFVHVGRALQLAAAMENGRNADEMRMISNVIQDMVVTLVVNEAPADFEIQTDIVGLPQFDAIIKAVAKSQTNVRYQRRAKSVKVQSSPSDSVETGRDVGSVKAARK